MTEECISIQGDSGHAQVNMVTDVYSHILDDDRRKNHCCFFVKRRAIRSKNLIKKIIMIKIC